MPLKPPSKLAAGIAAKSKAVNFFFSQDSGHLKRKWANRQNFWNSTRPSQTNEAPRWKEFESWREEAKSKK